MCVHMYICTCFSLALHCGGGFRHIARASVHSFQAKWCGLIRIQPNQQRKLYSVNRLCFELSLLLISVSLSRFHSSFYRINGVFSGL